MLLFSRSIFNWCLYPLLFGLLDSNSTFSFLPDLWGESRLACYSRSCRCIVYLSKLRTGLLREIWMRSESSPDDVWSLTEAHVWGKGLRRVQEFLSWRSAAGPPLLFSTRTTDPFRVIFRQATHSELKKTFLL